MSHKGCKMTLILRFALVLELRFKMLCSNSGRGRRRRKPKARAMTKVRRKKAGGAGHPAGVGSVHPPNLQDLKQQINYTLSNPL